VLGAGVRVYVVCIPIQLMLGIDVLPAIVLFVGLSFIYTFVGGIKAVIWTDAVQFLLLLAGGVFTLVYIPIHLEGGWATIQATAAEAGKWHWFNPGFSLTQPINIWMGLIGGTIMVMSSHGADQLIVQRVLACRNVREGRRTLVLSAVLILPLFLIFLLVGVFLWVYYQQHPMAIPIPEVRGGMKANDFIYPIFMLTEVPPVFKGLLIVAILAAAMSSVSSSLTSLASVTTMDFLKPLLPHRDEESYLRFSRYSTVFWALMLILVGYLSRQVVFVFNAAFSLRGLTSGALLGALLLAVYFRGHRSFPVVIGMLTALLTMLIITMAPQWAWSQELWAATVGGTMPAIFWPWYTAIGLIVCLATTRVVQWGSSHATR